MFYKNKVFLMLILFVLAMVLVGCNITAPGEPSAKVTITSVSGYLWQTKGTGVELSRPCHKYGLGMEVTPTGAGTVSPGSGNLCDGETVSISASPNSGYVFDFWTNDKGSIADEHAISTTFTMCDHNSVITAHFKVKPGEDGLTPFIGTNGNWWIGETDTGVPATGEDGNTPEIIDGYWWIDGVNTGVPATGDQGEQGDQGPQGPQGPAGQDLTLPDSIYVYYTITNIGSVNIQEYTITFEAETASGVYTGIATGEDLAAGVSLYSYVKIDVFGNEVTFVDYSLELK